MNVAAHVAAHQSSKRRQQENPQPPPPPPLTIPVPPLPPRPEPPMQQQHQQYPAQPAPQLPHNLQPFASLVNTATDPSTISLQLTCSNPKGNGYQSATINNPTGETIYTIAYDPSPSYSGSIFRSQSLASIFHISLSPFTTHWKRHTFRSKKLEFFFPWPNGEWGFDPKKRRWVSDVGLLPDHEFEWMTIANTGGYVLKCIDTTTGSDICRVVADSKDSAGISIPLGIIQTLEQLDEIVTVAVAMNNKVSTETAESGSSEVGSLKNTFEGINGVLGAVQASSGGGAGGF